MAQGRRRSASEKTAYFRLQASVAKNFERYDLDRKAAAHECGVTSGHLNNVISGRITSERVLDRALRWSITEIAAKRAKAKAVRQLARRSGAAQS